MLEARTLRLPFVPLEKSDPVDAVVARLRASIGLGLLATGARLPREADLAKQLGVSTFALREALSQLRGQGFVTTRPGKHGGSFVAHPSADLEAGGDNLAMMSALEVRELGEWREMVIVRSAELAAHRATRSNDERLAGFAEEVAVSAADGASRAQGRFLVELASSTQSMLLTERVFHTHERVEWLVDTSLSVESGRHVTSQLLRDIAASVLARDPDGARAAAKRYCERRTQLLIDRRLSAIARAARQADEEHGFAEGVQGLLDDVLEQLDEIAAAVGPLLVAEAQDSDELRASVASAVLAHLHSFPPPVEGVGVIAEVGTVVEHPYWLDWWHRTFDLSVPYQRVTTSSRAEFHDYETREFIARPRMTRQPWAYGPYIEYEMSNEHVITIASPVHHRDTFLGVVAADIQVSRLEEHLAGSIAAAPRGSVLVSAENRAIVSGSARYCAGDAVDPKSEAAAVFEPLGWRLVNVRE